VLGQGQSPLRRNRPERKVEIYHPVSRVNAYATFFRISGEIVCSYGGPLWTADDMDFLRLARCSAGSSSFRMMIEYGD
jgi:hypothetical protein